LGQHDDKQKGIFERSVGWCTSDSLYPPRLLTLRSGIPADRRRFRTPACFAPQ